MAIAHVATEYVFSDFLLKDPTESKYKGVRLELAVDKIVTFIAVGLPLLLISLAFAQEVSVGTQISCFAPTNFSWRQAAYVDSFCWAAVQEQQLSVDGVEGAPLWLHKFFPYILLLVAILMYIPALFWRFTAAPHLSSDLNFIMEELDRSYNRAIRLAKSLASSIDTKDVSDDSPSALDLTEGCFKYPLVEQYLKTKRFSRWLVVKYLACRLLTLLTLLLACLYLGYYIRLASITDEFACGVRTGVLRNNSAVLVQCKLVAVGVFRLLSYINLGVYLLLAPLLVYAALGPARQSSRFLRPYEMLPAFGALDLDTPFYNDLSVYLLFLEENLSELKSYKCLQVLELLREGGGEAFDTMCLLQTLGQVKTDVVDGKKSTSYKDSKDCTKPGEEDTNSSELRDVSTLWLDDGLKKDNKDKTCCGGIDVRQRVI
ncbi:pannexin-1-like isoform X1 [Salvelinus fontinalis]|uniref:pannexin-1-like isoform X1 n=1 Tax=Salvelinus fontinalis TaxID=8038 RepID=UPI00248654D8|nr:pannexin-1-like isoform X1 [Salvelinus fontinalis]